MFFKKMLAKSDSGSVGGILDAIGMEHKVEMSRKVQSENTQNNGCVDVERF